MDQSISGKGRKVPTLEPADVLSAVCVIQLSFCIRWALRPDWDIQKVMIAKTNLHYRDRTALDMAWGAALVEAKSNSHAMEDAAARLHHTLYDCTFLSCARIVALKGFEEDAQQLARLKELWNIDDQKADFMIELAKNEAKIIRIGTS